MIEEVCFFKYLILRDSYFHRKLSCVKINITLESSTSGNHSLHRREENSMKENKKSVSTRRALSHCKASKANQEDFIMLPTVDFCFKELMQNDIIIFKMIKNVIAELYSVMQRQEKSIQILWRCIS